MRLVRDILTVTLLCLLPLNGVAADRHATQTDEPTRQRFLYYFYEAQRLFHKADYQTAFQLIDFCHHLCPDDPVVNLYMGDFFMGFKRPAHALHYYETSYRRDPESESILQRLEQAAYYSLNTKKALHYQNLIDKRDGYDIYSALQRYHIYASVGDMKNARKEAEKYLKQDQGNLRFLLLRLQALETTKTSAKTLKEAYEQILVIDPENVTVMNNYAYFLSTHKGDLKIAEDLSRYAVRSEPDNPVFIDTYAWRILARGYVKFFNFAEREKNTKKYLQEHLVFPCTAYRKYNGFLGIVAWDWTNDRLFIASKSTNEGDHSQLAEKILRKYAPIEAITK
ncbi:MAG: hypothetical protein J6Y00_02585, partial [Paludibacteraceae bacterium]|nr:hypothetical protein [Paludibacteraceae bacterium]